MLLIEFVVDAAARRRPAASSGTSSSSAALSGTLNGSGSTFQTTFQQAAISAFKSVQPGMTVNYGGGGSGKGRSDLAAGVVNYAGSDSPDPRRRGVDLQGHGALLPRRDRPDHGVVQPVRPQQAAAADPDGHREHLPGQDHDVEQLGDRGRSTPGSPCPAPRSPSPSARTPRAPRRTSPCSSRTPCRACGRSAAARPSSGPPPPAAAAATAGSRRSSSPPPAPSGTWTTPTPRPPG